MYKGQWKRCAACKQIEGLTCGSPTHPMGMPCTHKFWMSANTRTLFWPLLTSFVSTVGFSFSFLCIWDVAHLICHPFRPISTIFTHFPSPVLNSPHHGDPEKAGVM